MSSKLEDFKNLNYPLPEKNLAWQMTEAGVENFGKSGVPDELPMPIPADDEILTRVDAIGICFSDVKLITQGSSHPRITGRDLVKNPVIAGHEVSLTIVKVGSKWADKYKPGERYIVQADVYYKGVNLAYGYALPGGMQQYGIIGEEILNGDEGSYIIPVHDDTGYAEAALVEPWTCVVAAYRINPRKAIKANGVTLVVQVEDGDFSFDGAICKDGAPSTLILSGIKENVRSGICNLDCCTTNRVEIDLISPSDIEGLKEKYTNGKGFDDVIVFGTPSPEMVEELGKNLSVRAVMAILADKPVARPVQIDVGRVHYDYINYIGTNTSKISDAYIRNRSSELIPNGTAWFIGAAGPMGQMHVQRAALAKNGPKKILCTDVDNNRLEYLRSSVEEDAKKNGIEMVFINPMEAGNEAVEKAINELTGGKGFDDIVVLAPVVRLIEDAVKYLADDGLMNIFAGVPRGTIATMDISSTYINGSRFTGSSGSLASDMVDTLKYTESGELPTKNSLAAIGGIDAMADGVKAVKEARFPGKTVIFPHIHLPLTALTDLKDVLPEVYAKLKDGKFWTQEAEDELLNRKLEI
ncbi:MAG: zinc-binding dehydrogenase [Armatimonadota bacterium]